MVVLEEEGEEEEVGLEVLEDEEEVVDSEVEETEDRTGGTEETDHTEIEHPTFPFVTNALPPSSFFFSPAFSGAL